jgi:hypothetical protein
MTTVLNDQGRTTAPHPPTSGEQLRLARRLYDDVSERVARHPSYTLWLDHALLGLEFRAALGADAGIADPQASFGEAMAALGRESDVGPWLYRGAAQAGWTAIQLAHSRGRAAPDLRGIDACVLAWLDDYPDGCDIDLPRGVIGLGVYALAHPDPVARERLVAGVLSVIEARAETDAHGLFVRMADSPERAAEGSAGCRIIGVAHGGAGLVSFLASAVITCPAVRDRARPLLDEALRWLLAQRSDVGHTVFPHRVELRYSPSRATWCSGDPGIALALGVAATATGSAEAAAMARHVGLAVLARTDAECGVVDATICHGAAGLTWFGERMARDLGLAGAESFAQHWSAWVEDHRAEDHLRYFSPWGMIRDASLLEGDAGAALVLLQAATGAAPRWEELLLATPVGLRR